MEKWGLLYGENDLVQRLEGREKRLNFPTQNGCFDHNPLVFQKPKQLIMKLYSIPPFKTVSFLLFMFAVKGVSGQLFTPVTITGFNHDCVAESGTSSLTTTTIPLDGVGVSNKVMYTATFRANLGFGGGGIPDNGTITDAAGSYQLAAYNGNNVMLIQRTQNINMVLATPAKFSVIRVLCFSTEGSARIDGTLFFTDGSSTAALSAYQMSDWFNNTTNLVVSGFGRCTRATPASGADGYTTNPRMYYIEIPISCTDRQKNLQRINFTNTTTAGNNAPYPNAVFMALSGKGNGNTTATMSSTNANCIASGSATLTVTGTGGPYTIVWNTNPTQIGATATNLAPGNYIANLTDGGGCVTSYPVTITLTNNLTMTVHADTSICFGASFNGNTQGNATSYSWSPSTGLSNATIANPVVSPTVTTQYSITGTLGNNCSLTKSFTVTVTPPITVNAGPNAQILAGQTIQLQGSGPVGTYLWTPATGLNATNIINPFASPVVTTTYTLRITTSQGCTGTGDVLVSIIPYCVKPMNSFTPNGDGINDRWLITNGPCLKRAMVSVYNRYGNKVYESSDYKNDWDGTYNGKPLPDATYYYVIQYELINGEKPLAKGDVTILR